MRQSKRPFGSFLGMFIVSEGEKMYFYAFYAFK